MTWPNGIISPLSGNPLPKSISQIFENESFQILVWMKMQLPYQLGQFWSQNDTMQVCDTRGNERYK